MLRKVPLRRKTPLRARKLWRPAPKADRQEFPDGLWDYIVTRDGDCVARILDPEHRCQGGTTVDHVPDKNRKGLGMKREIAAPNDKYHLVRMCWGGNVNGWASAHRDDERRYLAMVEPR